MGVNYSYITLQAVWNQSYCHDGHNDLYVPCCSTITWLSAAPDVQMRHFSVCRTNVWNSVTQTEPLNNRQDERESLFRPRGEKTSAAAASEKKKTGGSYLRTMKRVRWSFSCRAAGELGDSGELECEERLQQPEKKSEAEEGDEDRRGKRKRKCQRKQLSEGQRRRRSVWQFTCGSDGLLLLLFVTLIEVIQVADVSGFDAHQTGQTLHVFIAEEQTFIISLETQETLLMTNNIKLLRLHLSASNNKRHQSGKTDSRRFPLAHEDARQRQLESGLHHFDRQRLQLQRQVGLRRRRTGEPLQVDVGRCQHLTMPFVLLQVTDRTEGGFIKKVIYLGLFCCFGNSCKSNRREILTPSMTNVHSLSSNSSALTSWGHENKQTLLPVKLLTAVSVFMSVCLSVVLV